MRTASQSFKIHTKQIKQHSVPRSFLHFHKSNCRSTAEWVVGRCSQVAVQVDEEQTFSASNNRQICTNA